MRLGKLAVVGVVAMGVAACGGDDTRRDTAVTTDTVGRTAAETPGMAGHDRMEGMERFSLSGIGDSNISGEASFAPDGQNTRVMVTLNNATAGEMQGHIHSGTCDNIGPVVFPLEPINVQAGGTGTSTSTVNAAPQQIMEGEHVISYHTPGGNPGPPVVCGEVRGSRLGL